MSPHLALLVSVCEDLEAVSSDGEELHVIPLQQRHHLLQPAGQTYRHLAALLVKQQVVQGRDGVKQHGLNRGTANITTNQHLGND